jgi:ElaB/YqjD/DUF883 family membrane-anchored ribosome-binding protein
MEQEVPVIIHSGEKKEPVEEPQQETRIPEQIKEIGETLSEVVSSFRESESYEQIEKAIEQAKDFIRKKPTQAMLYSLGAGALLGLLMRKRR